MPANGTLSARGRVASLTRSRTDDDPELLAAKSALAAAKLEQFIQRTVASAPPLTRSQVDRLAAILRGGGAS